MMLLITVVGGEQLHDIVLEATRDRKTKKPLVVTLMSGTTQSVAQFPVDAWQRHSVYSDAGRAAKA